MGRVIKMPRVAQAEPITGELERYIREQNERVLAEKQSNRKRELLRWTLMVVGGIALGYVIGRVAWVVLS